MFAKLGEYGIEKRDIQNIGKLWKRNKLPVFRKYFGNKTTIKEKIDLWDDENFQYYLRIFREKFGIPVENFSIEEWKRGRIAKTGERMGKFFSKLIPEEKREEFQKEWDSFRKETRISGILIITIAPKELFFISDPAKWSSCHSFRHDYFLANFTYSVDDKTFLVYLAKNEEKDEDFCLPEKLWRVLGYWDEERKILILSRQYPYENEILFCYVRNKLFEIFFPGEDKNNIRVSKPNIRFSIEPEIDENRDFAPYVDYLHFKLYAVKHSFAIFEFHYSSPITETRIFKTCVQNIGFCSICDDPINLDRDNYETLENGEIVCATCFDNYFSRCNYCGTIIDIERDNYFSLDDGTIVCEYCFSERFVCCDNCGEPIYVPGNRYFCDDLGHYLCENCSSKIESQNCPNCGRETFFLERVHEKLYCEDCAEEIREIYRKNFIILPFFENPEENERFAKLIIG